MSDHSNSRVVENGQTFANNGTKNQNVNENCVKPTLPVNSDSLRVYHDSTEERNKSDSQNERSEQGKYRKNKQGPQSRVVSCDTGLLSKGSNLTRHLSQLSLVDNVRSEIPTHSRKCNVVFHYATMQLNFSPEVEKFVQNIVSILLNSCVHL